MFFLFGFVKLFFKPRNDLAQEVLKGICGNSNHGAFDGVERL